MFALGWGPGCMRGRFRVITKEANSQTLTNLHSLTQRVDRQVDHERFDYCLDDAVDFCPKYSVVQGI
jgi:hypothetical protein